MSKTKIHSKMSFQRIKLNYCVQCQQIDKEFIYNCRWLNLSFCGINCLKRFYDQIAPNCDLCKKPLHSKRLHLRDDVRNINLFTFICDECFEQRKPLAITCHHCSNVCYKGDGAYELSTCGLISKFACSKECKNENRAMKTCSECYKHGKCDQIIHNGNNLQICSEKCLKAVEQRLNITFVNCHKCSLPMDLNNDHVICDGSNSKVFCGKMCMNLHLREDTRNVTCSICRYSMRLYDCIRRIHDDRIFCSLHCSMAAETNIELLMRNDEWNHLKIQSLKCANVNLNSDQSLEGIVLPEESMIISKDQFTDEKMQQITVNELAHNKMAILNQCVTYDDSLERLLTAPKLEKRDNITKCSQCQQNIKQSQSFMQWENLEFCNILCYERYMYDGNYRCASCDKDSGICIGPNVYIIGDRQYYFCGERCEKTFFDLMKFCHFCRNVITFMNHLDGFCHSNCRNRFLQLYGNDQNITKKSCYRCQSKNTMNISLIVNKIVYEFCSFSCFFHLKTSCALFPDQCIICQMYFIDDASHILRYNGKSNVFCSNSCQAHYLFKYSFLEMCLICRRRKSNFNMLKTITGDLTIQVKYCSMQCLQLIDQTMELTKAYNTWNRIENKTSYQH